MFKNFKQKNCLFYQQIIFWLVNSILITMSDVTDIIFCLFERPFKVQKNGIFLFEISFFRFRDIDIFIICKLD